MRPLTIALLLTAIAACFVASLTHDERVAIAARAVYGLAFVASIIAFARGLPRVAEATRLAPTAPAVTTAGLRPG